MIVNDPSKLIRSIAKDMGVLDFLIRRLVYEDMSISHPKLERDNFYHRL